MICIYHNDADGHCAAAIVSLQIAEAFEFNKNFIEYGHGRSIELNEDDIHDGENVFIVDLALDENVMEVIRKCYKKGCNIVHIDHHVGGKKFEEKLSDDDKEIYSQVTNFYRDGISGCMLTYVYASMTPVEQLNPNDVDFDFTEDYSHVAFNLKSTGNMREYFIPHAVRYIDDNDVWRHQFKESRYFALAYRLVDNDPLSGDFWEYMLFTNSHRSYEMLNNMIESGKSIWKYQESVYEQANKNGFEITLDGYTGWAVNCPIGNSDLFCEKYDEYDFVCKFAYDGSIQKWRYTLYSKESSDVDCGALCRKLFAGNGHQHAAGGSLDYNYFNRAMPYHG